MKKNMVFALIILITCMLVACSPKPLAIFEDDSCLPPCWKGIIPGQTTLQEAKVSLQSLAMIEPASIVPRSILNPNDSINFQFRTNFREEGGYVYSQGNYIEGIWFAYDTGRLKLSEVLQKWGPADQYISIYFTGAETPLLSTSIIYEKQGVILTGVINQEDREVPKFGEDFQIESIWFINPAKTTEFLQNGPIGHLNNKEIIDGLKPWTGFNEIFYLTKDNRNTN